MFGSAGYAASKSPVERTTSPRKSSPVEGLVEASARVEFNLDPAVCRAVAEALKPEVRRSSERFVKMEVDVDGGRLILRMSGGDLADLRAGLNSYLHLVKASWETLTRVV